METGLLERQGEREKDVVAELDPTFCAYRRKNSERSFGRLGHFCLVPTALNWVKMLGVWICNLKAAGRFTAVFHEKAEGFSWAMSAAEAHVEISDGDPTKFRWVFLHWKWAAQSVLSKRFSMVTVESKCVLFC